MTHDRLCLVYEGPCCPWMGDCECQCICDWIEEVRRDEDRHLVNEVSRRLAKVRSRTLSPATKKEDFAFFDGAMWGFNLVLSELYNRAGDLEGMKNVLQGELERNNKKPKKSWKKLWLN
jgi:hypothetical protein